MFLVIVVGFVIFVGDVVVVVIVSVVVIITIIITIVVFAVAFAINTYFHLFSLLALNHIALIVYDT